MNRKLNFNNLIGYILVAGNMIYILWILRNAIAENDSSINAVQIGSFIGLIILLCLNTLFLLRNIRK